MSCTKNCQHAKKLNKGGLGNIEKTKKKIKHSLNKSCKHKQVFWIHDGSPGRVQPPVTTESFKPLPVDFKQHASKLYCILYQNVTEHNATT
jgi:hypothetical protein